MKNYILSYLMLVSCCVFAQNIEVKYYQNNIISDERLKTLPTDLKISFLQNTFSYTLLCNSEFSLYKNDSFDDDFYKRSGIKKEQYFLQDEKVIEQDDMGNKLLSSGTYIDNHKILKSKEMLYYKHLKTNKIFSEINASKTYQIIDKPFQWNWKITNETKEIAGFTCRKATSNLMGHNFIVWFTDDIPVNAGPEKFDGLPGLILYANSGGAEFIAYSIKILDTPVQIEKPVFEGKIYTFIEMMSEEQNNYNNLQKGSSFAPKEGDRIIISK